MHDWMRIALEWDVVRRGLLYAVIVGPILIAINHSDTIAHGAVTPGIAVKMALTVLVPYLVSTFSSVGAIRAARRRG